MKPFDYLIVGAGLYGSTFARLMTNVGKKCLVVEKREYVGGNCADEWVNGICVSKHGAHHFHTNDLRIWNFVTHFSEFNNYQHKLLVSNDHGKLSFPINLHTFYQLWEVQTPDAARQLLETERIKIDDPKNLEEWLLSQIGPTLYHLFYYGYTKKQWNREPRELPASIAKRIPIRFTFDPRYFTDRFQGMPVNGYTKMVEKMLEGIQVECGIDYLDQRTVWDRLAKRVVYTGPLDTLFDYRFGRLPYRSLRFENEVLDGDYQGIGTVNYTSYGVPYTRILEHKHYYHQSSPRTIITREYPSSEGEPYYPINETENNEKHQQYVDLVDKSQMLIGGRLAEYRYYDMHMVIGAAMCAVEKELG